MRTNFNLSLLLLAGLLQGCAILQSSHPKKQLSELDPTCATYEWESHPQLGPQAAIRVPIEINGHKVVFQLDTGADTSLIYDESQVGDELEVKLDKGFKYIEVPASLANYDLGKPHIYLMKEMNHPADRGTNGAVGTIGTDLLIGKILLLNFKRKMICIYAQGQLPRELAENSYEVGAELDNGKFIIPLEFPALRQPIPLFLDTGSSALSIFTDMTIWKSLVDATAPQRIISATVWGSAVDFIGASPKSQPSLNGTMLSIERVYYRKDKPTLFAGWNRKHLQGLVGLKPFSNKKWIYLIFDERNPRLGISRTE